MRPKLLALGGLLAVLAFLAWPAEAPEESLAASVEGAETPRQSAAGSQASALFAVGLATASLAVILQGVRPVSRGP